MTECQYVVFPEPGILAYVSTYHLRLPLPPEGIYIGCTLWKVLGVRFSAWLVEVQHRGALNKTKGGIGVKIFLHTSYVLAPSHGHCSYGELGAST